MADGGHDVFAVGEDWSIRTATQCGVQYGSVFACVDVFAREHGVAKAGDVRFNGDVA